MATLRNVLRIVAGPGDLPRDAHSLGLGAFRKTASIAYSQVTSLQVTFGFPVTSGKGHVPAVKSVIKSSHYENSLADTVRELGSE